MATMGNKKSQYFCGERDSLYGLYYVSKETNGLIGVPKLNNDMAQSCFLRYFNIVVRYKVGVRYKEVLWVLPPLDWHRYNLNGLLGGVC